MSIDHRADQLGVLGDKILVEKGRCCYKAFIGIWVITYHSMQRHN